MGLSCGWERRELASCMSTAVALASVRLKCRVTALLISFLPTNSTPVQTTTHLLLLLLLPNCCVSSLSRLCLGFLNRASARHLPGEERKFFLVGILCWNILLCCGRNVRGNFQRPGALLKKDPFFHTLRAFLDAYDALCHKIAPSHKKVVTYAECVSRDCHLKDNQLIGHDWLSKMHKIFLLYST